MDASTPTPPLPVDGYSPSEISRRVETMGVAKARTGTIALLLLAILAGAFISLGALLSLVVVSGSELGFGPSRLLGGVAFSLGLILVLVGGAELFTGNNLLAMAWASRLITTREVVRNWLIVYLGNVIGCLGTIGLVLWGGVLDLGGGVVRATLLEVAAGKTGLTPDAAFARGILCNALVCLAVWLAMGGRSITDKVLGIVFPVAGFVALGLEHSIANWFILPLSWMTDTSGTVSTTECAANLAAVTAGNIVGGTLLVAGVYWVVYLRRQRAPDAR